MRPRHLALIAMAAAGLGLTPAARADTPFALAPLSTSIAARDGFVAFWHADAATKRSTLMLRRPNGSIAPAPVPADRRGLDVSLGHDARGRLVALYPRCGVGEGTCDVFRLDIATGRERRLAISRPNRDERLAVQDGPRIAFVRTDAQACDRVYVMPLGGEARRMPGRECTDTVALALRGRRLAQLTLGGFQDAYAQDIRLLDARDGQPRTVFSVAPGETREDGLTSLQLGPRSIYTVRDYLTRQSWLRIDLPTGKRTEVRSRQELTGDFARDERGRVFYAEQPPTGYCYRLGRDGPCRLSAAGGDPFDPRTPRALPPTLSVTPARADPLALAGRLETRTVAGGRILDRDPIAGAELRILSALPAMNGRFGPFTPTAITTMTGPDGRFAVRVPGPAGARFSAMTTGSGVPTYGPLPGP